MGFTLNQLEQERQIRKLQKKEDQDTKDYEKLSNLPKINNVELKGDKTTSDLGINADNVMMADGVTSVEVALDDYYDNKSGTVLATATADGVKTYAQLLVELYPYRENGCYIDIDSNRLYGNNATNYGCVAAGGSNKIRLYAVYLASTTAYYLRDEINNNGVVTFTDLSSTVPATGNTIKLIRI